MPFLILLGIGLWFLLGSPAVTVADWFWEHDAAPWETVDAFYYPDKNDLSRHEAVMGLGSVQECRDQVERMAFLNNDPRLLRSSYECGIQKIDTFGDIGVYRATVD